MIRIRNIFKRSLGRDWTPTIRVPGFWLTILQAGRDNGREKQGKIVRLFFTTGKGE